jgi:hypothetical protein
MTASSLRISDDLTLPLNAVTEALEAVCPGEGAMGHREPPSFPCSPRMKSQSHRAIDRDEEAKVEGGSGWSWHLSPYWCGGVGGTSMSPDTPPGEPGCHREVPCAEQ